MDPRRPLSDDQLRHIVQFAPLIAIDLVIFGPDQRALVGFRNNEPAKGCYFAPGGMIRKGETREIAFSRLVHAETGLSASLTDARFIGVYEHHYSTNRFKDPSFGTHYVVLGYRLELPERPNIQLDDQHSHIRWMTGAEILAADDVHENTKAYFRP